MSLKKLDRYDAMLAALVFLLGIALYVRTLTPGLLTGDSGEFQTLAFLLGDTHPTGYPVYLVLAKLATFLPWRDVAYRVNLFSALMGALAISGIYLSGRMLVNYRLVSLLGALALAVSPTFWSQAIIAEVYTAGAAVLVFILFFLLLWDQSAKAPALFAAGILGGLSLGVHLSVALFAPAVVIFLLLHWQREKRTWAVALAGAGIGVIVTVMIFSLLDAHNPAANYFNSVVVPSRSAWGLSAAEIDGLGERLIFGWSARQFRSFLFADIARVMPLQAADYWKNLPHEFSWPIVWLAVLGLGDLFFRRLRIGILLAVGLALQLFFVFNYEIWDLYVFYIPSYCLVSLLAVAGMGTLIDLVLGVRAKVDPPPRGKKLRPVIETAVGMLVLVFAIWPVFKPNFEAVRKGAVPSFGFEEFPSFDEFTLQVAQATVNALPENSILFTDWEMMWPYYYADNIIGDRKDLLFIETHPADDLPEIADSVTAYVAYNIQDHPVLFTERESKLIESGYKFVPARYGPLNFVRVEIDDQEIEK